MRSMLSERVIAAPTTFRIGRQRRDFFSFHLISSCGGGPLRRVTRAGTRMMILRPRANCAYSVPASARVPPKPEGRSEEHTSELQSLMRISYAVFCLKKKIQL